MSLSKEQVRHVALLARLGLEDGEEEYYASQLSGILAHLERMSALDTEAIAPTAQVVAVDSPLRADEVRPGLSQEQALAGAPSAEAGYFKVRSIQEPEP